MAKSISDLIAEADEIICAGAQKIASDESDVFKLASELRAEAPTASSVEDYSLTEKIARSIAIVDTLINMPELIKIAAFEKKAKEAGHTPDEISSYFEKKASVKFKSVLEMIPVAEG